MLKLFAIGIVATMLNLYGCISITANYKMSSDYNKRVSGPRPEIVDNKTNNTRLLDSSTNTDIKIKKRNFNSGQE